MPALLTSPNPALVTQRAAQRLPRLALLLFCAAYVLPGLFGRDPWKNADIAAFGYMVNIASGHTPWLAPTVGGMPADAALLPYWLGASSIKLLAPLLDPTVAARLPFAALLALVLVLTWFTTYHFASTDAAQPLPFAFGGEANPVDYARAIADGALLALVASLGLLQLGHETTPELVQLASFALFLYALAASPFRPQRSRLAVMAALPALAASGAPSVAMALGLTGVLMCRNSSYAPTRRFSPWVIVSVALAAVTATALSAWGWRIQVPEATSGYVWRLIRQFVWFTWPAWPLTVWTLWQWRRQWRSRHILIPLGCAAVAIATSFAMGGSDRALMLALPSLAVLAAFALPTLQRSTAAAIDWFSVFFFTGGAIVIWVVYAAMQTGIPAKTAANIARLSPGYTPHFSSVALALAALGTLAWLWLVKWRTGRNRHPLWKSLVLPASGVALCWLLAMTLLLPPLDNARSYRWLVQRLAQHVQRGACIAAPGSSRAQVAALEYLGGYRVDAVTPAATTPCPVLLQTETRQQPGAVALPWKLVIRERRTDDEIVAIYRRSAVPN